MKPTRQLPYIVIVKENGKQFQFTYATEDQAKRAAINFLECSPKIKTSVIVSIKKGKRGAK